jgi:glycosyltransferase involved in cell wall biosynthesis
VLDGETLVVFADDWGVHPSSAQHLLRRFLGRNRVVWVNTVGQRLPRPGLRDARKLLRKLGSWSGIRSRTSPRAATNGQMPEVRDLPLAPLPLGRPARWCNARWLRHKVRAWLDVPGAAKPFILTTLPLTADLIGAVPGATFVYYLVDDYASWPGLGGRLVRRMDEAQARGADLIVAASQALAALHQERAPGRVVYLPHGVDVTHFGQARSRRGERPLADAIFFGALDERIDLELLRAVMAARPAVSFLLVGPGFAARPHLAGAANVTLQDAVPYEQLPALLAQGRVALLPYVRGPFGERLSPLKAREALAAGLPVVATDIPELRTLSRSVYLGRSVDEITAALDRALAAPADVPTLEDLAADSWEERAERLSQWLAAAREGRKAS